MHLRGGKMKTKNKSMVIATAVVALVAAFALGCAPKAPAPDTTPSAGTDPEPAFTFTWSKTVDCTGCHSEQAKSTDNATMHASVHKAAGATCVSCHDNEAGLTKAHKGATATAKMPETLSKDNMVKPAACLQSGCHVFSETVTANSTVLTDLNGTVVNPHEVMTLTAGHADIVCADCHQQHMAPLSASQACVTCHHAGVYECGTCH